MTLVCTKCFGDRGLQRRIEGVRARYPWARCDLHPTMKGVPIKAVSDIVDEVFRANYGFTNAGFDREVGESLEETLYGLTEADDEGVIAALIAQLIEDDGYWPPDGGEAFYDETASYERTDHALWTHSALWDDFRESIQFGQRFFNAEAKELLAEIFQGVHLQRSLDKLGPVYQIKPGQEGAVFYRARIANDDTLRAAIAKDVASHLGPPPPRNRRPGRMNPSGVGAFYGAFDLDTCIAELRPPVGSIVMGARFEISEPLLVLDMTRFHALPKELNLFAADRVRRAAQWRFMRRFMDEIAQPISPTDEHLDYIPTQAVAEYLAHHHEFTFAGRKRKIDAVIFASAQNPEGRNIAILGGAAQVRQTPMESKAVENLDRFGLGFLSSWRSTPPPFRLIAKPDSLEVRRITGARFDSREYVTFNIEPDDLRDF